MVFYYLTLLLIPFNNHPLLSYNFHGITPIKVVGGVALIAALLDLGRGGRKALFFSSRQSVYFLLFSLVFFFSFAINDTSGAPMSSPAMMRFVSIWMFYITTLVLVNTRRKFIISIFCVIASMDIASLYIYKQHLMYRAIYSNFRPKGIFGDPNFYALSVVAVLPLCYFLFTASKRRLPRLFCFGSLFFCLGGLVLSQSRGGMLGFGVTVLLVLFYRKFRLKAIASVGLILALLVFLMPQNIEERLTGEGYGAQKSTEMRYELLLAGKNMFMDKPFLGIGPGYFKTKSKGYNEEIDKNQMAHNSYVEIAAELGFFGLLFFGLIFYGTIKDINRKIKVVAGDEYMRLVFLGIKTGLFGFLVSAAFLSASYEKVYWFFIFAVVAARHFMPVPAPVKVSAGQERFAPVYGGK